MSFTSAWKKNVSREDSPLLFLLLRHVMEEALFRDTESRLKAIRTFAEALRRRFHHGQCSDDVLIAVAADQKAVSLTNLPSLWIQWFSSHNFFAKKCFELHYFSSCRFESFQDSYSFYGFHSNSVALCVRQIRSPFCLLFCSSS